MVEAKPSKYKNRKVVVDGINFDSAKEGRRWIELTLLAKTGAISNLRRQVRFPLSVNGQLICTYISDFCYTENGHEICEDVKSAYTRKLPVFRIKLKLMRAIHGVAIRET